MTDFSGVVIQTGLAVFQNSDQTINVLDKLLIFPIAIRGRYFGKLRACYSPLRQGAGELFNGTIDSAPKNQDRENQDHCGHGNGANPDFRELRRELRSVIRTLTKVEPSNAQRDSDANSSGGQAGQTDS